MPVPVLLSAAHAIRILGKAIGRDFAGIHPDRVKKLMISANTSGEKLANSGFRLYYNLKEAIRDWYNDWGNEELA